MRSPSLLVDSWPAQMSHKHSVNSESVRVAYWRGKRAQELSREGALGRQRWEAFANPPWQLSVSSGPGLVSGAGNSDSEWGQQSTGPVFWLLPITFTLSHSHPYPLPSSSSVIHAECTKLWNGASLTGGSLGRGFKLSR